MIREACVADIDVILGLGLECHREAFTRFPVDVPSARRTIATFVQSARYFAWVHEADGEVLGCLLGGLEPVWFNPAIKEGSDLLFYVRQDPRSVGAGRRLLKHFMRWGGERGARGFAMAVSFGGAPARRTGKIYEKEGFTQVGGLFYWQQPQEGKVA